MRQRISIYSPYLSSPHLSCIRERELERKKESRENMPQHMDEFGRYLLGRGSRRRLQRTYKAYAFATSFFYGLGFLMMGIALAVRGFNCTVFLQWGLIAVGLFSIAAVFLVSANLYHPHKHVPCDGNKSLYLVFVGVVFSQYLGLLLGQLGQHLRLLLEQLGQQHLGYFLGQQHLDCF
jgi:hypothetical protein